MNTSTPCHAIGDAPLVSYDGIAQFCRSIQVETDIIDQIETAKEWMYERLCNEHPELGRKGAVCPYYKGAVRKKLFWFSPCLSENISPEEICSMMLQLLDTFIASAIDSSDEIFRTITLLFPKMQPWQTQRLIDETHEILKPSFIEKGVMLGQFHKDCTVGGIHNPDFMALQTPMPLFVIRNMVPTDYIFLQENETYRKAYTTFCAARYGETFKKFYAKTQALHEMSGEPV